MNTFSAQEANSTSNESLARTAKLDRDLVLITIKHDASFGEKHSIIREFFINANLAKELISLGYKLKTNKSHIFGFNTITISWD